MSTFRFVGLGTRNYCALTVIIVLIYVFQFGNVRIRISSTRVCIPFLCRVVCVFSFLLT